MNIQMLPDAVSALVQRLPGFAPENPAERLSGGLINYVWRVHGRVGSRPASVIAKWAPPYIASSPQIPMDQARIVIEAKVLEALGEGGALAPAKTEGICVPYLVEMNENQHVLIMEDLGNWPNLGTWLRDPERLVSDAMTATGSGRALGGFIGALHRISSGDMTLARSLNNRSIQQTRLDVHYRAVRGYCARACLADADELGERVELFGESLLEPGQCVVMGDLWPPSILVAESGLGLIDWEFTTYGRPAQDVGHLAAHLPPGAGCRPSRCPSVDARAPCVDRGSGSEDPRLPAWFSHGLPGRHGVYL